MTKYICKSCKRLVTIDEHYEKYTYVECDICIQRRKVRAELEKALSIGDVRHYIN